MISNNESICPRCGAQLAYYDSVPRIVRTKDRQTQWIKIRRLHCNKCGLFHRELPSSLLPFKQYEAELIRGVLEGLITADTLGYEDYPCEMTMLRWMKMTNSPISTDFVCTD